MHVTGTRIRVELASSGWLGELAIVVLRPTPLKVPTGAGARTHELVFEGAHVGISTSALLRSGTKKKVSSAMAQMQPAALDELKDAYSCPRTVNVAHQWSDPRRCGCRRSDRTREHSTRSRYRRDPHDAGAIASGGDRLQRRHEHQAHGDARALAAQTGR
jgi:hypothetical protein